VGAPERTPPATERNGGGDKVDKDRPAGKNTRGYTRWVKEEGTAILR